MSRSYRKTPFLQVTGGGSNKQDKRFANRKLRRIVKQALSGWTEYTVFGTSVVKHGSILALLNIPNG
jgi:hypothetical protein